MGEGGGGGGGGQWWTSPLFLIPFLTRKRYFYISATSNQIEEINVAFEIIFQYN